MNDAMNRALNAYSKVDLDSAVNSASPVQLIIMLYDGAISALAMAKGHMQEKHFADKGRLISKAIGIIDGLSNVLDHDKGGVIARNLGDLYDYMKHRLSVVNLKNDPAGLDEVIRLLNDLRGSWVTLETRDRAPATGLSKLTTPAEPRDTLSLRA